MINRMLKLLFLTVFVCSCTLHGLFFLFVCLFFVVVFPNANRSFVVVFL